MAQLFGELLVFRISGLARVTETGHALLDFFGRGFVGDGLGQRLGIRVGRAAAEAAGATTAAVASGSGVPGAADVEQEAEITTDGADFIASLADLFQAGVEELPLVLVLHVEERAEVFDPAGAHIFAAARLLLLSGGGGGEATEGEGRGGEEG